MVGTVASPSANARRVSQMKPLPLPHSFKFIIQHSSCHFTLYSHTYRQHHSTINKSSHI